MSYDIIGGTDSDYNDLFDYIDTFPAYAHVLESSWVVQSNKSATVIRDEIHAATTVKIRVMITAMGNGDAAYLKNTDIDYLIANLGWKSPQ